VCDLVTVTAVAALVCLASARSGYRRWRSSQRGVAADEAAELAGSLPERDRGGALAFAGFLLSLFSLVAVLFVGFPALVFEC